MIHALSRQKTILQLHFTASQTLVGREVNLATILLFISGWITLGGGVWFLIIIPGGDCCRSSDIRIPFRFGGVQYTSVEPVMHYELKMGSRVLLVL